MTKNFDSEVPGHTDTINLTAKLSSNDFYSHARIKIRNRSRLAPPPVLYKNRKSSIGMERSLQRGWSLNKFAADASKNPKNLKSRQGRQLHGWVLYCSHKVELYNTLMTPPILLPFKSARILLSAHAMPWIWDKCTHSNAVWEVVHAMAAHFRMVAQHSRSRRHGRVRFCGRYLARAVFTPMVVLQMETLWDWQLQQQQLRHTFSGTKLLNQVTWISEN